MIKNISQNKIFFTSQNVVNNEKKQNSYQPASPAIVKYADSFVKNAGKSTPVLLSMTLLWSFIDKNSTAIPLKKAFVRNMKGFFLPVLISSSALITYFENKKTKNAEK